MFAVLRANRDLVEGWWIPLEKLGLETHRVGARTNETKMVSVGYDGAYTGINVFGSAARMGTFPNTFDLAVITGGWRLASYERNWAFGIAVARILILAGVELVSPRIREQPREPVLLRCSRRLAETWWVPLERDGLNLRRDRRLTKLRWGDGVHKRARVGVRLVPLPGESPDDLIQSDCGGSYRHGAFLVRQGQRAQLCTQGGCRTNPDRRGRQRRVVE